MIGLFGQQICLWAAWLYDHGFDNRLYFIHEGFRRLGVVLQGGKWDGTYGEDGASLVEYALLIALIAVVCILTITFFTKPADEAPHSPCGADPCVTTTIAG